MGFIDIFGTVPRVRYCVYSSCEAHWHLGRESTLLPESTFWGTMERITIRIRSLPEETITCHQKDIRVSTYPPGRVGQTMSSEVVYPIRLSGLSSTESRTAIQ